MSQLKVETVASKMASLVIKRHREESRYGLDED